ncbi:hypothetical protein [Amycolatopsis sp. NPDC051128]|uniref:hypothetical protein n=1 Tax=Amycolatopsis sp. NPDC051128 TaxID=3155412 RepID=UPI003431C46E
MRYGYFAYELRKTSVNELHYELVGFAAMSSVSKHDKYVANLRTWALDLLRSGQHEAGLFSFSYGEVNEYDEMGKTLADLMLAWDGTSELTSADHPARLTTEAQTL